MLSAQEQPPRLEIRDRQVAARAVTCLGAHPNLHCATAIWFFGVGLDAERYAVTALHGLMRRKVCDVKEYVLVARVGLDESE